MTKSINKQARLGVGVMILKDNKVLLGQRHSDPNKADSELHGEGTWTMPGGKVDFQEKLKEAISREVFEEIGLKIDHNKLKVISITDDIAEDAHFVTIGFLYRNLVGKPKIMEPDEITQWKWFALDALPSKVFPPSKKIIDKFVQSTGIY